MENSRLIVKGLPSNCTEKSLQQFFKKFGAMTDCTLKYTKEGKFRKFAFIGFDNAASASKAIAEGNNSFMQSSKIQIEICHPFGDANKPRAWSKFAKDSSAYKRSHGDEATSDTKPSGRKQPTNASTGNMSFTIGIDQLASTITSEESPKTNENNKLEEELLEGITGDTSLSLILSGLPSSIKQKNIKEWLAPIRIKALKIVRDDEIAAAFVSFNRVPDVRRALQMDGSFLGGFKVFVKKVNESDGEKEASTKSSNEEEQFNPDEVQKEEDAIRDTILETGRLFVRNLPFVTTEDDLRFLFKKYGELADVQVIIDKKTGKCKGFAIVEFIFPENAVAAYSELDGSIFKGRMLHIIAGNEKRENKDDKNEVTSEDEAKIGYKAAKEKKLKATSGVASHSWNALFLGPNAIADSLAEKLGKEKREIFDPDGKQTAGVKLALAETSLVQETRNFLIENGVQIDAFSRPAAKRSDKVILVKNLPLGTQADELERMFSRHGGCEKIIFPERGISALIVMGNKVDAKKVFQSLAYSRFRTKPLFLEWAPGDVFGEKMKTESSTVNEDIKEEPEQTKDRKRRGEELTEEDKKELRKSKRLRKLEEAAKQDDEAMEETKETSSTNYETHLMPKEEVAEEQDEREIEPDSTVFVKNLSFDTTDAQFENFFKKRGMKYQSTQISKKLNPADPFKKLSMGFGFVQFYTKTDAENAVKELQGHLLNGHALELKISNREVHNERGKPRKDVENTEQKKSTKILVRNLPFQASVKEIEELFATFGEIKTVRIPKKMGTRDQHRGFGFVEFMSVGEAKRAFESLVHSTHLYGRRLVLEWAKDDDTVEEMRTKTSTRYSGNVGAKKRVKKRIDDLQAEIFAAGNVGDPEDDEE
ncbi:unnamed protein product, partial [Mesorhabditis belari]|uniref:RRM domain-containing protein n=1 Tax=Mesorhabditis belari TaxID=2138241 RepID=A0AAF3J9Z0_9BILA